jgi:hypothetical protein
MLSSLCFLCFFFPCSLASFAVFYFLVFFFNANFSSRTNQGCLSYFYLFARYARSDHLPGFTKDCSNATARPQLLCFCFVVLSSSDVDGTRLLNIEIDFEGVFLILDHDDVLSLIDVFYMMNRSYATSLQIRRILRKVLPWCLLSIFRSP